MRWFLILLLASSFSSAVGQQGFNQSYDLEQLAAAFGSIELTNDTLIVYGNGYQTGNSSGGMCFAKIDTLGNLIDFHIYNDSLVDHYTIVYPNSLTKLSDSSGYAAVGQFFFRANGYFAKFDNNGLLVNLKEYEDLSTEVDFFQQIIEVENGFIIAGNKFKWAGELEVFVMKIDNSGNVVWESIYGNLNRNDTFGNIFKISDNEFIIGSATTSLQGASLPGIKNTSKIFAIDSLGNIQWEWESVPSLEELGVGKLFKTQEGHWAYMSGRGWYNATYNEISVQPKFIIRDEAFNLIYEDTFGMADNIINNFYNTIQLNDGGWLAVGIKPVSYPVLPEHTFYNSFSGWMARLDHQGNQLWNRLDTAFWSAETGSTNYYYDAVELPSGSIVVCGYSRTYEPAPKDWGWLIKVDKNGCVDTLFCAPVTSSTTDETVINQELKIYPNPAQSVINIAYSTPEKWDKIEGFNAFGQVVIVRLNEAGSQIDISWLSNGIYYLRFTKGNQSITRKIVKKSR